MNTFDKNEPWFFKDIFGDFMISLLPGIVLAVSFFYEEFEWKTNREEALKLEYRNRRRRLKFALLPILFSILWFSIKRFYYHQEYKVTRIGYIIVGNVLSFIITILAGKYFIQINQYK